MTQVIFEEKQYLGFNKTSIISRLILALFCIACYYWNNKNGQEQVAELFLMLSVLILVISLLFLFVLHLHTKVQQGSLELNGFWTTRKVKINLSDIKTVQSVPYNKFYLNNPVYNLHIKGKIRFYTRGDSAIQLEDKDGLVYLIGSQRPNELHQAIMAQLNGQ